MHWLLFLWGTVIWLFPLAAKWQKNKWEMRKHLSSQPLFRESKGMWEKGHEAEAKMTLKVAKIISPIFILTGILGLFIKKYFKGFNVIQIIVFFSGVFFFLGQYPIMISKLQKTGTNDTINTELDDANLVDDK